MKPLIPILIVAIRSLAVASVQFARQASTERARADAEMALRQKSEARVAELERAQRRFPIDLSSDVAADEAPVVPAPDAKPPGAGNRSNGPGAREPRVALSDEPMGPPRELFNRAQRMAESPAARKFMQSRVKNNLRRLYEDVGNVLGLSSDKSNQLIELLAEQQTRNMGQRPQPMGDLQKKNQAEVASLIGQDKLDEWQAYQKTLPQRSQLNQVREQLDGAGVPMSDSQRSEMLAAISDEAQRNPRPAYNAGLAPEETAAQMSQWQTEYDKSLLDRARSVLTAEQFQTYKEYQDWQTEMRNALQSRGFRARSSPTGGVAIEAGIAMPFVGAPPEPR